LDFMLFGSIGIKRILMLLSISGTLVAQEPVNVLLSGMPGPYSVAQWKTDWPGCTFEDGVKEGRFSLVKSEGMNWLRALYPKGAVGPNEGGGGWRMPFASREEAELRYTIRFEEGFDFKKGGKLPGLCGGPKTITGGDAVSGKDGFSVRLMWRKEGRGQAYVYHMDQPSKYGDEFDFPGTFRFPVGVPVTIRLQVRLNTPSKKDGTIRIWTTLLDGAEQLQLEKTGLRFRQVDDYGIDSLLFNTFHGGSDESWGPTKDVAADFARFEVQ
jgi:hypothetical protein